MKVKHLSFICSSASIILSILTVHKDIQVSHQHQKLLNLNGSLDILSLSLSLSWNGSIFGGEEKGGQERSWSHHFSLMVCDQWKKITFHLLLSSVETKEDKLTFSWFLFSPPHYPPSKHVVEETHKINHQFYYYKIIPW